MPESTPDAAAGKVPSVTLNGSAAVALPLVISLLTGAISYGVSQGATSAHLEAQRRQIEEVQEKAEKARSMSSESLSATAILTQRVSAVEGKASSLEPRVEQSSQRLTTVESDMKYLRENVSDVKALSLQLLEEMRRLSARR